MKNHAATEEEAAEAYDIAAIKFRGMNAVTNFEMNRYDVEAIAKGPLPIGGTSKRLKLSLESEDKLPIGNIVQTPCIGNSISFSGMQPTSIIPYGVPFDVTTALPFYNNHHLGAGTAAFDTSALINPPPSEFFIWPHHSY